MADSHLPPQPCPAARREFVLRDLGGWISGPSADVPDPVEAVAAGVVRPGDHILMDGTEAEVTDIRHGWYHYDDDSGPGVALGWHALRGSASGVAFRRVDDEILRVISAG